MSELSIADYGQERERIATENELAMFQIIKEMTGRDDLVLVRKCNDYVTACLGDWDLARFKYTTRARWIMFPVIDLGGTKRRIASVEEVRQFPDELKKSLDHIALYSHD